MRHNERVCLFVIKCIQFTKRTFQFYIFNKIEMLFCENYTIDQSIITTPLPRNYIFPENDRAQVCNTRRRKRVRK